MINETTMKFLFEHDYLAQVWNESVGKMVIAVKLPTGATELIINTSNIEQKFQYYMSAYDDAMCLKTNPEVRVVNWMFVE